MNLQRNPTPGGYGWGTGTLSEDLAFCCQGLSAEPSPPLQKRMLTTIPWTRRLIPREAPRPTLVYLPGPLGELLMARSHLWRWFLTNPKKSNSSFLQIGSWASSILNQI